MMITTLFATVAAVVLASLPPVYGGRLHEPKESTPPAGAGDGVVSSKGMTKQLCMDGIVSPDGSTCCAKICGSCGGFDAALGKGCGKRPGGGELCCTKDIRQKAKDCKSERDIACMIINSGPDQHHHHNHEHKSALASLTGSMLSGWSAGELRKQLSGNKDTSDHHKHHHEAAEAAAEGAHSNLRVPPEARANALSEKTGAPLRKKIIRHLGENDPVTTLEVLKGIAESAVGPSGAMPVMMGPTSAKIELMLKFLEKHIDAEAMASVRANALSSAGYPAVGFSSSSSSSSSSVSRLPYAVETMRDATAPQGGDSACGGITSFHSSKGHHICCASTCGSCGEVERGCSKREGGEQQCCAKKILGSELQCGPGGGDTGCLLKDNTCAQGIVSPDKSMCCASSCEKCGGSDKGLDRGCGKRPGGADACCASNIIKKGKTCSARDGTAACLMPHRETH